MMSVDLDIEIEEVTMEKDTKDATCYLKHCVNIDIPADYNDYKTKLINLFDT